MGSKTVRILAGAAALAVGTMAHAAPTPFIGVNFVGGSANGAPTSLAAGDVAGLVPQSNFNNVANASGAAIALNNSSGGATGVTLTFAGAGTWGSGSGSASPNAALLNGYVDGTDNGSNTYTFNNVPAGKYNIIVYALPDGLDGRDQSLVLNGDVANTLFMSSEAGSGFAANGFVRATATSKDGPGAIGNYFEFDNVSPQAGTFALVGTSLTFRNFSNGIQIVNADVPEPATLGLVALGGIAMLARRRRQS